MKSSTARLALNLGLVTVAVSLMCIGNYWLGDDAAFLEFLIKPTFIFRCAGNWRKKPHELVPVVGGGIVAEYSRCDFPVVNGMGTQRSRPS